ncbi:VWA domain-containing protein [Agromyces rhizosphaerae]|uniref:VWA domain-containing protein n=1 Tax=Agromyces rhizosphaerae TaxID=88374 RepID=A0A9W6CWL7_9MICO|nr:substrate-binding domain-containing protein [Agromyces rhizosphaerae]GLI27381.1 VWA domain-containing protein [Agromyces rhizosphaerae]
MSGPAPTRRDRRAQRELKRRRRRRTTMVVVGSIAALLLIGGGAFAAVTLMGGGAGGATGEAQLAAEPVVFPQDEPAAADGAGPCTTLNVLSSFENAEMVEELANGYNAQPRDVGGACVDVVATRDKSGIAAEDAAEGFPDLAEAERPAVWIPDAATWLGVARDAGAGDVVPESGTSLGASDIVLAMPEPLADAIGWDDDAPTWDEVLTASEDTQLWADLGHPEWGGFQLGKTSPVIASSGEAAMFVSYGSASGSVADLAAADVADEAVTQAVRDHELAVSHYMATPEHFLWHARQAEERGGSAAEFLSAVIVDEKSVWDYNRGITSRDGATRIESDPPAEKLVAIYPTDGFYVADNPAVVLTADWVSEAQQAAADDFIRYAGTEQGQQIVRDYGYRDLNGVLSEAVAETGNLDPAPVGVLDFPEQDVVVAVHQAFPDVRKRAQVLFLIDASGSMDDVLESGQTRLEGAKDAITLALDHFAAGDDVGLAAFSSGGDGVLRPGLVSPVQDIGDSRDEFLAALDGLEAIAYTPLFEAVDEFALQQSQSYDPDRINAIVLLSDGTNNTAVPTTTEEEMLSTLDEVSHTLLVFTLAYGADADVEALQAISGATGAHYYDATDPLEVEDVLGDLVTSF